MKIEIQKTPKEIERKFNEIRKEINNCVLFPDKFRIPSFSLFEQLETEYVKISHVYKLRNDQKNLLHVAHNFHWSLIFKHLKRNPSESLKQFFKAFSFLLERNLKYPYKNEKLDNMLGTYELAIIKISEENGISFDNIWDKFQELIDEKIARIENLSERMIQIINILCGVLIKSLSNKIKMVPISISKNYELDEIEKDIDRIIGVSKKINSDKAREVILSKCFESYYILKKRELHFLVQFIFFENKPEKKKQAQLLVDKIVKEMLNYAKLSLKHCTRFIRDLPEEYAEKENIKLMKALKEIDVLCSEYYQKAYYEKDIFQAWKQIDKIRHFLVKKYFVENIKLSEELLEFFSEEWALLDVFAKANLFRIEVEKREEIVNQEWEKKIFQDILTSLGNIKKLFKYEVSREADYRLKIIAAQFSGGFSEYFIHDLFEEYYDCCEVDERTPNDFRKLMVLIRESLRENIKRNDFIEQDKPDIDIHIKNKCAVFLKNAKLDRTELNKIKRELDLCRKYKIKNVFYAINFVKNLRRIEEIYNVFKRLKEDYLDLHINIFDIKDMVEAFLDELKRSGKSKLNFSRLDLYKILDY